MYDILDTINLVENSIRVLSIWLKYSYLACVKFQCEMNECECVAHAYACVNYDVHRQRVHINLIAQMSQATCQ